MGKKKWKPLAGDIIILILGRTGAGKSTFINAAAGTGLATIGHDLESCTTSVDPYVLCHPEDHNQRVILVDTPGFDDSRQIGDKKIMKSITNWLKNKCGMKTHVAGIILLHEINQNGKLYSVLDNIRHSRVSRNVILATTKWRNVRDRACRNRESELVAGNPTGAVRRFQRNQQTAWAIIDELRAEPSVAAKALRECLSSAVPVEEARDSGIFSKLLNLFR